MTTVIYEAQCSHCGAKVKWVGTTGNPDVPTKDRDRIVCLTCHIFGQSTEEQEKDHVHSA